MDREQVERIFSLYLATWLKYIKVTPIEIQKEIRWYSNAKDEEIPERMAKYKESIELYKNTRTLNIHLDKIKEEFPKLLEEVQKYFDDMGEKKFIQWYKERKKT